MITTARKTIGPKIGIVEHREMIKALSSKDENLAERLMRKHIKDTLQRLDTVMFDENII